MIELGEFLEFGAWGDERLDYLEFRVVLYGDCKGLEISVVGLTMNIFVLHSFFRND